MGKGLCISENTKGLHVAFAAGTGVLVFIDLICRIALTNMELIPTSQRLNKDFKFHLYVAFKNREQAMCLQIIDAVEKLMDKMNKDMFKITYRFSEERRKIKVKDQKDRAFTHAIQNSST